MNRLFSSLFKDRTGYVSRKLTAAWFLTFVVTLLLIFHPIWTLVTAVELAPLLKGSHYVTIISLIWSTYFAADIAGNTVHTLARNNSILDESSIKRIIEKDSPDYEEEPND